LTGGTSNNHHHHHTTMGKKSKRNRSSNTGGSRAPPAVRAAEPPEVETKDNLHFEDPYVEEYIVDDDASDAAADDGDDDDDDKEEEMKPSATSPSAIDDGMEIVQAWNPLTGQPLQAGEELEMDPSAYKMHHAIAPEWPSLSFDLLRDHLGEARTRFPLSLQAVVGTQADAPDNNSLTVLQISDLSKMQVETEDDILGEEYNPDKNGDDDSDDESEDEIDLDPVLEHYSIPHYGGVNRVRAMPQQQNVVATWSDVGHVNLFNIEAIRQRFEQRKGTIMSDIPTKPFYTYKKHATEGFAMDWSPVQTGHLATGDCNGRLHLWTPRSDGGSSYSVSPFYQSPASSSSDTPPSSIEDIQWSPTEATVLAAAQCDGYVRIFDTRAPNKAMLSHQIHSSGADVNVLSWNTLVSNLLATGGDDGTLAVWDLRHFSNAGSSEKGPEPLARFTPHKTPITSVEWHPTDESMLAASDDVGVYIYDLSVEEDNDAALQQQENAVPPQLLFVHCGSEQFKEVHWHQQISSCLMTTALTGFSMFIPSNL